MLSFVQKHGYNVHSQNGEDGIILECLLRMDYWPGHAVEIGANDGLWMSNTRNILERGASGEMPRWSGLLVESDFALYQRCVGNWKDNRSVRVQCCHVNGTNINAFVDDRCDVFSSDTDGADYEIFAGLKAKPKIVIVEIDSGYPPDESIFNRDGAASYRPMVELGIEKGYFLLCHTGNIVFVVNEYRHLFPEIVGDGLTNSELYFNTSWLPAKALEAA
jgi:hypothetical protein